MPVVFFLFHADHMLDLPPAVMGAGVFHAIGGNEENHMVRGELRMNGFHILHGLIDAHAHCIQQGRASSCHIVMGSHLFHCPDVHPIMEKIEGTIKKDGGHMALPGELLLFFDETVKSANGIVLIPRHGSALINDAYQFRPVFSAFHNSLLSEAVGLRTTL